MEKKFDLKMVPWLDEKKNFEDLTLKELVDNVRKIVKDQGMVNEKYEMHLPGNVRYAFALAFSDGDKVLLVYRKDAVPADYPMLDSYDFPVASRGILPDGSFKVNNSLDDALLLGAEFTGIAIEEDPAAGDKHWVVMPCYLALISKEKMQAAVKCGGVSFSKSQIREMASAGVGKYSQKGTGKVAVLAHFLQTGEKSNMDLIQD